MSALSVDIALERPEFRLEVRHAFPESGLTVIFGPSGAGKSTLLRLIAGFEPGAQGNIRFGGESWQAPGHFVPPHRRGIGYVFQDARLFTHLTVGGNLDYAETRARRAGRTPDRARVVAALGLDGMLGRSVEGLSGGERQRVAIARALLTVPKLLLMDEPLAALDDTRKAAILPYIETIRDAAGIPVLYVSHSVSEAGRLADNVLLLRDGRMAGGGPAAEVWSNPELAPELGVRAAGSLLTAQVVRHHQDGITEMVLDDGQALYLPIAAATPGDMLRVRIAAQDVILARTRPDGLSALNIIEGRVTGLRRGTGPGVIVQLRVGGADLLARVTRRSADALGLSDGMTCFAVVKTVSVAPADIGHVAPGA